LLTTMAQLQVPADRVQLVLNKVEPDVGMDVAQVTRHFPQGFEIVVPYGREANRSLNAGMPVLAFAPHSDVSKALGAGLASVLPTGEGAPVAGRVLRERMLGRLRRRSA
ncbi:MAG TPA: hypothetical protein VM942_08775, partial [Acidimicrobiales bacterium]|nr:hypothetical protein [Acidimicrobiales bacterium]